MGERVWVVYERFADQWESMIYTVSFTRHDAITRWRENQSDQNPAWWRKMRKNGWVRVVPATLTPEQPKSKKAKPPTRRHPNV